MKQFNDDHNVILCSQEVPSNDLFQLTGRRLVFESTVSDKFDIEKIKELTGGDAMGSRQYVEGLIKKVGKV